MSTIGAPNAATAIVSYQDFSEQEIGDRFE